jgi:hypothetical protein
MIFIPSLYVFPVFFNSIYIVYCLNWIVKNNLNYVYFFLNNPELILLTL